MKKLLKLSAVLLLSLAACKKKKTENIVKYKLNGVERTVTGNYSQLDLVGLKYYPQNSNFGFAAYKTTNDEILSLGIFSSNVSEGTIIPFLDALDTNLNRLVINIKLDNGQSKTYGTLTNNIHSGNCTIVKNNDKMVSGTFISIIYPIGLNPSSDSIIITDGYFYFNK